MMAALSFNVFSFMFLACTLTSRSEILHQRPRDAASPANRRMSPSRTIADLPDVHLTGFIVIKIKSLSYIRELSYEKNNLTRRLIALCEIEMAKFFKNVKGKQTVKVESFRRGRWSKVILLMLLHSTGNGDINEISDTVKKNVQIPGRFITYDVDRKMASFRPNGVFCQPRVHYAFESLSASEVYDDSGYDNNGIIYGNVTTTNYGKCGRAAKFKNGYVFLRKFKKTKTSDSDVIVIAFWLRMHQPRSTTSLFRGYYKGAVVEIFTQRGLLKWKLITQPEETAFLVRHVKLLKPRTWTHVVAVYDPYAFKAKLYIDLELVNEVKVRQGIVHWRFTSSLRFGMTSTEGYLDDLYVYDCLLSENVLNGIRKDCWCEELCAPRGKNEFLVRMLLTFNSSFNSSAQRLANRVRDGITNLFTEISGEQRVETIGQRPINADSIIVDYSLQSIGNSDTRYLAGVIRPSITSGSIAGVDLASRDVSFIPISGKSVCRSTEMSCGDGDCISKLWKCDGEINCADGRDEVNCGDAVVFDCQSNEFACNRSRVYGISDCIEARFRCDGQLDCDDDSDEFGCVPPKVITAPRSLIILAKGETARCTCAASGVPHPKVSWYSKGRKILSLPEKISVTSVAGHGQLTIFNVGEKDSGDYICQISNNRVRKIVAPSCTVKVRALGSVCASPFFNSIAQRSDECLRCFCYEKTMTCRSAVLYRSKLQSYWNCFSCTKMYEPILVDVFGKQTDVYLQTSSSPLFWRLPKKYSGNKITSYGGRLQFALESDLIKNALRRSRRDVTDKSNRNLTVWNYIREGPNKKSWLGISASPRSLNDVPMVHDRSRITRVSQSKALNLSDSHMVYIMGNDGTLLAATQLNSYDGGMYGIDLIEKQWMDTDRQRNIRRSTLLRVLTNIKYIFIKATSSNGYVLRLRKFSLDSAVSKENDGRRVHLVEQCTCPEGYSGYSCEKCSDGYFRRNGSEECLRCSCNGHSSSCDHKTGRCNSCDHNTSGMNCEVCKAGFYGDATVGTPYDCKKCNCPLTVESNSFSETCYLDRDGKSTCNSCFPGYTGRNCEICDSGYEGNPSVVGGTCYSVGNFSKCHSAGSMSQSINSFSKVNCHCKKNVVGTICDKCREGPSIFKHQIHPVVRNAPVAKRVKIAQI
ncbi:basement membrane-specific heparan sulfate proteoglycan core protein-like [Xenia sp. Carnegie-2017]|uniref:basement membrane-specific heparan sulfate proteoglycan core protein-like n=1 Tax=Xenia sp. Carnegie-2017 TaxID=2897299 RepID=UPI001F048529|nr:basement membrane-specific heparan sulfate proteoglycan core protein-like [Xenia sp. Carnegie-2017]